MHSHYHLELPDEKKRIFVTQLREDEENDGYEEVQKIPVIKEKAGRLIEIGFNTLQNTLLLKRQSEAAKLSIEFEKKKDEFNKRIQKCKEEEERIKDKEIMLRARTDKFSKFIEENNRKKQRAIKKYKNEMKLKEAKIKEIEMLYEQMAELEEERDGLIEKLQKYEKFGKYLNAVVDVLPLDYMDMTDDLIKGLMARYQSLEETCNSLNQTINANQKLLDECGVIIQQQPSQLSEELLLCNKEITCAQEKLQKLQTKNARMDYRTQKKQGKFRMNSESLGQILLAIENLTLKCERGNKVIEVLDSMSVFQKLDQIQNFLKERESVYEMSLDRIDYASNI